jgi:hypothetical protein
VSLAAPPSGCGGLKPTDPDQARAALAMAVDAWHEARTIDDVTTRSPPITVADPAWKAGYNLTRYQVAQSARAAGFELEIPVELWLEDPKGRAKQEQVKYTVSVDPSRTVIRPTL